MVGRIGGAGRGDVRSAGVAAPAAPLRLFDRLWRTQSALRQPDAARGQLPAAAAESAEPGAARRLPRDRSAVGAGVAAARPLRSENAAQEADTRPRDRAGERRTIAGGTIMTKSAWILVAPPIATGRPPPP